MSDSHEIHETRYSQKMITGLRQKCTLNIVLLTLQV